MSLLGLVAVSPLWRHPYDVTPMGLVLAAPPVLTLGVAFGLGRRVTPMVSPL